jgi:hypothetical protein
VPPRSKVRTQLNRNELRRVGRQATGRKVAQVTRKVFNRARVLSPWDQGNLRGAHTMSLDAPVNRSYVRGRVLVRVRYALPVHEGSQPHIIRPKKKKALRFVMGGHVVIVRQVRHPGTKARPWLMTALQEVAAREGFKVVRRGFTDPGDLAV